MRILVAHQVPRARTGGMSRIMGFIHDRVAEAGHEVDYLCADDVPASWHGAVGRRVAFPLMVRRRAVDAARAGRRYDIVNVHESSAAPIATWKRAARSPAVVVTSHGLERRAWELAKQEERLGREGPGWRTRLTYPPTSLWPTALGLRMADHVFCLNDEDRDYLTHVFGRKSDTVTRIHPAADPIYAAAAEGRDYTKTDCLLFAGTWRKNKGVEDLVPAFATLAGRHPAVTLLIVGPGASDVVVRSHFPEWLHSRIVCETPASEAAMAAVFARADVFLLPSLFEGTPLTLVQAMMSGLPIVTTDTCGMKDLIVDGTTGLLAPIRSPEAIVVALERVLADRELRERLGRSAQQDAATHYTWDRVAAPVERVYEELCDRHAC